MRSKVLRAVLLLAALCPALAGCVLPYRALPLADGRDARHRPFRQDRGGVLLAADLIEPDAAVRATFHEDLADHALVAVVLHIEVIGERTAVLLREDIGLQLEGMSGTLPALDPEQVIAELRRGNGPVWLGLPLLLPAIEAREDLDRYNFALERDYRGKALPAYLRLVPGDPARGRALFFRVTDEHRDLLRRSPVLELRAELEAGTGPDQRGQEVRFLLSLG